MTPDVEPGYLRDLLPDDAPINGENWADIVQDIETKIMPGVWLLFHILPLSPTMTFIFPLKITHWQHPHFHAYFPAGNSYPSILGEMLSSGLGIVGFSWAASPACTELETIVLFWLGKMLGLPKELLPFGDDLRTIRLVHATNGHLPLACDSNTPPTLSPNNLPNDYSDDDDVILPNHTGGAVLLATASECVLVAMLSARTDMLHKLRAKHPFVEDGVLISKLVAYTSKLVRRCRHSESVRPFLSISRVPRPIRALKRQRLSP